MVGILTELCISWLILWLVERKNLSILGLTPTGARVTQLLTGFAMSAACCAIFNASTVAFVNNNWIYNKQITTPSVMHSTWWVLKSVLFEELIFRGALLYIAIKRMGIAKGCYLSAACFGIYHWFSQNAFGNPVQMIFIFIITAVAGLMFAFSYAKTNSLYLPIGLHLGWNFINIVIFSNGPLGNQLLTRLTDVHPQGSLSILIFLFQVLALPLLTWWMLGRIKSDTSVASPK